MIFEINMLRQACNRFVSKCLTAYHDQNMCSTCIVSVVLFQIMKNGTHESENGRGIGDGDVKFFLAHLVAMGLVKQSSIERYWEHGEIV